MRFAPLVHTPPRQAYALGLRPTGARALREYVRGVRALLRGEDVAYSPGGGEALVMGSM